MAESWEAELLPPLSLHLPHLPSRIQAWRGILSPCPQHHSSGTQGLPPLPQLFIEVVIHFLPHRVLRKGDPLMAHYENTQLPAGGHECHEQIKLQRLSKASANRLTQVLSTPSLKGVGLTLGFRSTT
jgi:hypothetical protein